MIQTKEKLMNLIDKIEAGELKKEASEVRVGDTVRAHIRIIDGEKERFLRTLELAPFLHQ